MNSLLDIQEKLQDTSAALARLSGEIVRHPDSNSLRWDLKSLERRRDKLELLMLSAASAQGREVCRYRLIPEQDRVRLSGLVGVLGGYQNVLTGFYHAKKSGKPKSRAVVSAESVEDTALDFGYAFAGSVGFVFTVPAERGLFNNSELGASIQTIAELARTRKPEEILRYAKELGAAPIRALFKWADAHVKASLNADIEWRHGDELLQKTLIQLPEFVRLRETISATSEEDVKEFTWNGVLQGADVGNRSFHFRPDSGDEDIRGSSGEVISQSQTATVPQRYTATLRKTTRVLFSTEEEKTSWELLELSPV